MSYVRIRKLPCCMCCCHGDDSWRSYLVGFFFRGQQKCVASWFPEHIPYLFESMVGWLDPENQHIPHLKALLKFMFLFPCWDMFSRGLGFLAFCPMIEGHHDTLTLVFSGIGSFQNWGSQFIYTDTPPKTKMTLEK